jgi:hypothetical protein
MRIDDIEANYMIHEPKTEMAQSRSWNGHSVESGSNSSQGAQYCLVARVKEKEKEVKRLKETQPSKAQDPQGYFTYKARIEQLKYEIDLKKSGENFARLHWVDAAKQYSSAHNHLKRRTEAESDANKAYLQRIKNGEDAPPLDIDFINSGKRPVVNNPGGGFQVQGAPGGQGAQVGYAVNF